MWIFVKTVLLSGLCLCVVACSLSSGQLGFLQGLVGLLSNPVLANGVAGLATSATAFAAVERTLLYQMRNATVEPFGETVQQVFARISALRDSLDGPQVSLLPCQLSV